MSISQSVILRHSDFEFEQVIVFEFSLLSYFQYNLRSISAIFSYFTLYFKKELKQKDML